MRAEDVARAHFTLPGFHLEAYGDVALPYWRLVVRVEALDKHEVGPLGHFALRAVSIGVNEPDEIAALLGLDEPVLDATLVGLLRDNDLALAGKPQGRSEALRLTKKGRRTFAQVDSIVPREVLIELHYDGLLRKPVAFVDTALAPRDAKSRGLREVPPARSSPPTLADLPADAIRGVVRRLGTKRSAMRDILALKSIDQRTRIFQPAVALIYRSDTGPEARVEFAVDGRISPDHGEAFEQAGLKKRLGIDSGEFVSAEEVGQQVFGSEVVRRAQTSEALRLQEEIAAAEQRLAETPATAQPESEDKARAARDAIAEAEAALAEMVVRPIETFEHPKMLDRALTQSRSRLVIVSPWIRERVVDKEFLVKLEQCLEDDVRVYLGWGMSAETRREDIDKRPREALERLAAKYRNFSFVWFGDSHSKLLISDDKFAIATSFNWLSFKGDPRRTFRDERGMLVSDPEVVELQFEHIRTRFGA